jgi:eukaryotic-like serine/threonine-protein kinase
VASKGANSLVGEVLAGTYRILTLIKKGGMGVVYEAENVRLPDVRYAVKVLHSTWSPDMQERANLFARFQREAEIIARLRHPNIVSVLDFNQTATGDPFLVMELLHGEDLQKKLKREQRLAPEEMLGLLRQIGGALQLAHDRGVIHRDIKPSNIFLSESGEGPVQAKLLDFGISKSLDSSRPMKMITVEQQVVIGTAAFMAPEQARGTILEVDHTSDIFSLATIVYRALTGEQPFTGPSDSDVRYSVCFHEPPTLSDAIPGLPARMNAVLRRAHAKNKADRYQRVDQFVKELVEAYDDTCADVALPPYDPFEITGPRAPAPVESFESTGPHLPAQPYSESEVTEEVRRKPWILVSVCAVVAAAGLVLMFLFARRPAAPKAAAPVKPDATRPVAAAPDAARAAPDTAARAARTARTAVPDAGPAARPAPAVATRPAPVVRLKTAERPRPRPRPRPIEKRVQPKPRPVEKKIYYFDDV